MIVQFYPVVNLYSKFILKLSKTPSVVQILFKKTIMMRSKTRARPKLIANH